MAKNKDKVKATPAAPSSNWLALKKVLPRKEETDGATRKRRKLEHNATPVASSSAVQLPAITPVVESAPVILVDKKNGESISALTNMVLGKIQYTESQQLPGKYLALDCEMVGVGLDGEESSLARVSLVNYHGAIQLDEFVRQRERVVDYRTQWSGVREVDMIKAKPFEEIQKQVAELLKDKILIGHAVYNDTKALLLSHPRPLTRDTQYYAGKFKVMPNTRSALRNLVKQELDLTIQGGEHSSVTDARATMAVYRLHRKEWEKGNRFMIPQGEKRKRETNDDEGDDEPEQKFPGGGRKGVSSGLGTIVKRGGVKAGGGSSGGEKAPWWKELGTAGGSKGAKGSMRV